MKSLKKNNLLIIILFVITILMSVGFAIISTTLNINGQSTIKKQTWDIHFENVSITNNSVTAIKDAVIANDAATLVEYEVTLEKPGDFYEFTVDVVNEGTLDSLIEMISLTGVEEHEDYLTYQVSYLDGTEIKIGDALNSETSETYKVRVEYKKDLESLPSEDIKLNLVFAVTYSQGRGGEVITNYYTLTGTVYDTEGQPMTSGEVEVHSRVIKAPINSDGTYILKNVPVGDHEIFVKNEIGEIVKEDTFTLSSGSQTTTENNEIVISGDIQPEINILVNKGVEVTIELPKHTINIIGENGETKELKVTKGESKNISILPDEGYQYLSMTCTTNEDIKYNQETKEVEINNINENTTCNVVFEKMEGYDEGPVVTLSQNGTSEYQKEVSTKVDIETKVGSIANDTLKYIVSDNKEAEATKELTNGQEIAISDVTGEYYIIVEACNSINICNRFVSNPYYMDNIAPTITYGTNGNSTYAKSQTTTVTASDSHSTLNTLKYITGTSDTATPSTNITNGGTVIISSGTGDYYVVTEACDKAGNCATLASNVFKMDNTGPTIVYGTNGSSTYAKSRSTTVTATDSHTSLNTLKYITGTSNIATPTTALTSGGTVTISGVTGNYYVVTEACDTLGNCTTLASNVFKMDNTGPTITYGTNGNSTYAKSRSTTVTATDGHTSLNTLKYITGTSNTATPTTALTSGGTVTISGVTGNYYVVSQACDTLGNCTTLASNVFKMDNTAPTITYGTNGSSTYAKSRSTTVTASDSHSTLNSLKYITGTSNTATPSTSLTNGGTVTISGVTGNYYVVAQACDKAGNCKTQASNVFKMDNTKPTATATVSGKSASIVLKDSVALAGYQVTTSASATSYTAISGTSKSVTYTATAAGTYYVHVKDSSGNTASTTFTIASSAFCSYTVGQVWNYAYTGGSQSFTTPCNGTYKLEVWGAQGGTMGGTGGLGGYSYGNKALTSGGTLYIVVGGSGIAPVVNAENADKRVDVTGGYNGGGNSSGYYPKSGTGYAGASGGGATHIGTFNKTLAAQGSTSGLYIVAGGGGGGGKTHGWYGDNYKWKSDSLNGGTGGGTSGGNGQVDSYAVYGIGATQSAGGHTNGKTQYSGLKGTFGQGGHGDGRANNIGVWGGGGGGGLYGGGSGWSGQGGGGGSGYIGGVTSGSMQNGQRSGNGYARITLSAISN